MEGLLGTLAAATGVFVGTNLDDVVVLTVLFLSARSVGRPQAWQIWTGQYAGIVVLVVFSVVAALGLTVVPDDWVGLLGLAPLALGLKGLVQAIRAGGEEEAPAVATGLFSVAWVTIANGADNVSAYTPLFRTIGVTATLVTVGAFLVMVALLCAAGSWLGSHRHVVAVMGRFGHWIVPSVFVVLGVAIIVEFGLLG